MHKAVKWTIKSFVVLLSLFLSLLVAEWIAVQLEMHTEDGHTSRSETNLELHTEAFHFCYGPHRRMQQNPRTHTREIPNSIYFQFNNDQANLFRHNELGYRGRSAPGNGKQGVFVVGDSFTRGSLADETETIPAQLSRWSGNFDYLNFGTGGHGTLQHAITYDTFRGLVDHEAILLLLYIPNDLTDNISFKRLLSRGVVAGNNGESSRFVSSLVQLHGFLQRYAFGRLLTKTFFDIRNTLVDNNNTLSVPDQSQHAHLNESFEQIIALKGDKPLFVVTIPGREEFDTANTWPRNDTKGYAEHVRSMINLLGSKLGFKSLHLGKKQLGINRTDDINKVYGWPDYHFTEYGYYRAANAIAEWLESEEFESSPGTERLFENLTHYDPKDLSCPEH